MAKLSEKEIDDQVAAEALQYGSKSGPVPPHSSMQPIDEQDAEAGPSEEDYFDEGY